MKDEATAPLVGEVFETREEALRAGAPTDKIIAVHVVPNGPFKGHMYERKPDGRLGRRIHKSELKGTVPAMKNTK